MKNNSYIQIDNLSKSYGFKKVLNEISLDIDEGDFVTLFGPNGAGKTTLIRILSTILKPDRRQYLYFRLWIKKRCSKNTGGLIGLLSHDNFLYQNLTVMENLTIFLKIVRYKGPRGINISTNLIK